MLKPETVVVIILVLFCFCNKNKHSKILAKEYNNKAMALVPFIENSDSCNKALGLLDTATHVDSTCFLCHYNKLMFLLQLKQANKAIITVNKLIELRPLAHDLYMTAGSIYEQMGDTVNASAYFRKSLSICNQVLDTMSEHNRDYDMLVLNKGLNLIMIDHNEEGNVVLKKLYNKQPPSKLKSIASSFINKRKKEILISLNQKSTVDSSSNSTSDTTR
jgi:tetratricopeptide (TPR) repeat protein